MYIVCWSRGNEAVSQVKLHKVVKVFSASLKDAAVHCFDVISTHRDTTWKLSQTSNCEAPVVALQDNRSKETGVQNSGEISIFQTFQRC